MVMMMMMTYNYLPKEVLSVHLPHEVLMLIKIYNVGSTAVEKHMASFFRVQDRGSMWAPTYQTT